MKWKSEQTEAELKRLAKEDFENARVGQRVCVYQCANMFVINLFIFIVTKN